MTTKRSGARKKAPSVRWLQRELARVTEDLLAIRRSLEVASASLRDSEERRLRLEEDLESAQGVAFNEHMLVEDLNAVKTDMRVDIQALRENVRLQNRNFDRVIGQLKTATENGQNSGDAAVVLAYLLMPSGALSDIMAHFQQTAVKLNIGPEVKKAATEAISRASTAFAAGEWPDDKLAERLMAEGGADPMAMLGMIARLDPEGFEPLTEIFGRSDPRRARESRSGGSGAFHP